MESLEAEIEEIFRDVFDDPGIVLTRETTAEDIEGWDSLTHINLIIALERELGIKFATAEISQLKEEGSNVGSIMSLVAKKRKMAE